MRMIKVTEEMKMKSAYFEDLDVLIGGKIVCTELYEDEFTLGGVYEVSSCGRIIDNLGEFWRGTFSKFCVLERDYTYSEQITELRNIKLDCRNPDGTVDTELNLAFQEAVCGNEATKYHGFGRNNLQESVAIFKEKPFLFVDDEGMLSEVGFKDEKYFFQKKNYTQIDFTYKRSLTWEASTLPVKKDSPTQKKLELQKIIEELNTQLDKATTALDEIKGDK